MRVWATIYWAVLLLGAVAGSSCGGPARSIRAVIRPNVEAEVAAMRAAPIVLVVRIAEVRMTGDERLVEKPPGTAGPPVDRIPLHLARIDAEVLFTVRGEERAAVTFYSWVWHSGQHGGPRLFRPAPDALRVVFLGREGEYLHTVGDYPAYDLRLQPEWTPALVRMWKEGELREAEPLRRLTALRLRAELGALTEARLREDFGDGGPYVNHYWALDLHEWIWIGGPVAVANELEGLCERSGNRATRFAACYVAGNGLPGRCDAFRIAREAVPDGPGLGHLDREMAGCRKQVPRIVAALRNGDPVGAFWPSFAAAYRDEILRVFASATERQIHEAACEAARIPECDGG